MGGASLDVGLLRLVALPAKSALSGAYDGFLVDREAMRCTVKTLAFYRYALGDFLRFLTGQSVTAPAGVTAGLIRLFLVELDRKGLADTTVHLHARAVKTFCRWMLAEGLLSADPMARVTMPRLEKRVLPALTADQVAQLLAVGSVRERAVVLCLLDSGLRASEFVGLNVGDVDVKAGAVIVHQGKGRKDRVPSWVPRRGGRCCAGCGPGLIWRIVRRCGWVWAVKAGCRPMGWRSCSRGWVNVRTSLRAGRISSGVPSPSSPCGRAPICIAWRP